MSEPAFSSEPPSLPIPSTTIWEGSPFARRGSAEARLDELARFEERDFDRDVGERAELARGHVDRSASEPDRQELAQRDARALRPDEATERAEQLVAIRCLRGELARLAIDVPAAALGAEALARQPFQRGDLRVRTGRERGKRRSEQDGERAVASIAEIGLEHAGPLRVYSLRRG